MAKGKSAQRLTEGKTTPTKFGSWREGEVWVLRDPGLEVEKMGGRLLQILWDYMKHRELDRNLGRRGE